MSNEGKYMPCVKVKLQASTMASEKHSIQENDLKLFSFYLLHLQNSPSMCVFLPEESVTFQYTWLSATMWFLGIEIRSSERAARSLNC